MPHHYLTFFGKYSPCKVDYHVYNKILDLKNHNYELHQFLLRNILKLSYSSRQNSITSLPPLPPNLLVLNCSRNDLASLPENLPSSIHTLICYSNFLEKLPTLPPNLIHLNCSYNDILDLNVLPKSLQILKCDYNLLTSISHSIIDTNLIELTCDENLLTSLQNIPPTIKKLSYRDNYIIDIVSNRLKYNSLTGKSNLINSYLKKKNLIPI